MSRSNPRLMNPATQRFEWSGSKGELSWYDKEIESVVKVPLPFEFMVLDQMSTITGWNARVKSQVWSNEVRAVGKDILYTYTKSGPLESGLYSNLTNTRASGGKYTKVIYIAFKNINGAWQIGKIMAVGSCLSAWIEFAGKNVVEEGMITMTTGDAEDGPSSQYFPPHFKWAPCGQEANDRAIALDTKLQQYFKAYLAIQRDEAGQEMIEDEPSPNDEMGDIVGSGGLDTPTSRSEKADMVIEDVEVEDTTPLPPKDKQDVVIDDIPDEPINLDDIPF